MKRTFLFFILAFHWLVSTVYTQSTPPVFVSDSLDNYITRALAAEQLPGVAVCVVKDGQVVLLKGYGVKEWGKPGKVDENTLFMIGSNTKAFTATALAMLDSEEKLSLNDKVTRWIPEFRLDNRLAGEQAIIRDLLSHRIGFGTFQGDFTYWKSNLTRAEVIEKMGHIKALYPFRTIWGYCNAAFLTAGEIIPRATGVSWEDYLRKEIFDPLGMTSTLALTKDFPTAANRAAAHDIVDGKLICVPYCMIDNLAPTGSIGSSVNDLSKWVLTLLNKGRFGDVQVIPEEAIDETRYPHSIVGSGGSMFNRGNFDLYGLGFGLRDYEGRKIVSHTGAVTGFLSSVTLVPEENLGIVVLTNSIRNSLYYSLSLEILDAYLGLPYRNYSRIFEASDQRETKQRIALMTQYKDSVALHLKPDLPQGSYVGNYTSEVYGMMQVVQEEGELRMKFQHHPQMYARMESLGGNRFYVTFTDPEFETAVFPFAVEDGKVKSVTVKVADFIEYTPYVFYRTEDPVAAPKFRVIGFHSAETEQAHMSFVHEANRWFSKKAAEYGFTYDSTTNWNNLNTDFLSDYQVVIFLDSRPDGEDQRAAFQTYMEQGGAWMGFHFAGFALTPSDVPQNWDWYHDRFLGSGSYKGNTWRPTSAVLRVEDRGHPATARLPDTFKASPNEWYSWEKDLRANPDIKILLSIDPASFPLGTGPKPYEIWHSGYYPVVWTNQKYRMLYVNMGHNDIDFESGTNKELSFTLGNEIQDRMILDGLLWLGGR